MNFPVNLNCDGKGIRKIGPWTTISEAWNGFNYCNKLTLKLKVIYCNIKLISSCELCYKCHIMQHHNSLCLGDSILDHKTWSSLAQAMPCLFGAKPLPDPSHYPTQWWLTFNWSLSIYIYFIYIYIYKLIKFESNLEFLYQGNPFNNVICPGLYVFLS